MSRVTVILCSAIIVLLASMAWAINHYRDNAIKYQDQRNKATEQLSLATATITDMQTRQQDVAALDAKYTRELADAQSQIETLRGDVAIGKRRLQLAATCAPKANATGTGGMDDGDAPQLTANAELNYWRLRSGIETITKQVTGLQEYINTQSLN